MAKLNIRTLKQGERVKVPGIYKMDISTYHSDCCDAPSFSSGDLVKISQSGEEYWDTSPYNPDRPAPKHIPHLNFGNAAHARILDPEAWQKEFILRPREHRSWRSEAAQMWRMVQERGGKTCITEDEVAAVDRMAEKIQIDPTAQAIFSDGIPELSLFCRFEDIWIKARPDMLPIYDVAFEVDYKSTADNSISAVERDIEKWGYDQKLANIAWVKRQLPEDFPDMPPVSECAYSLIFQKTARPHGITCVDISPYDILDLTGENLAAAQTAAACMRGEREWTGYTEQIHKFQRKPWTRTKLKDRLAAGIIPKVNDNMDVI